MANKTWLVTAQALSPYGSEEPDDERREYPRCDVCERSDEPSVMYRMGRVAARVCRTCEEQLSPEDAECEQQIAQALADNETAREQTRAGLEREWAECRQMAWAIGAVLR